MAVAMDDVDDVLGKPFLPVFGSKIGLVETELGHDFIEMYRYLFDGLG
jgi:hypothetical protein